jgi:hypothetical protein
MTDSDPVMQRENEGLEAPDRFFHASPATRLRLQITPYLPPPVVVGMKTLDPKLEPYLGPEASVTLLGTVLIGLLLWKILWMILGDSSTTRGAIQDVEEDDAIVDYKDISYDGTVLFCGPSLGGKTSLFYSLVYPTNPFPVRTVSTLKPNTGFVSQQDTTWRYLDTPGHWSPSKLVSTVLIPSTRVERIVLVLDSTQSVSKAADYLFELLRHYQGTILVAGHKSKEAKAKNVRRLKLQLRTELERLSQLESSTSTPSDWEDILSQRVVLVSTSVDPPVLEELREYLETGKVSQQS